MTELDMHTYDRQVIRNILAIPQRRLDIPPRVLELYEQAIYAKHAVTGQPGGLSDVELRLICLMADAIELPRPVACKFGELVIGTPLYFRVSKYEVVDCQFVAVQDAAKHLYQIRLWGDIRHNIPENQLSLEDPRQKDAAEPKPTAVKPAEPPPAAPQPLSEDEAAVQEQRIDLALSKMQQRWPIGKRVDCCPPGAAALVGTIQGYDRHGNVQVHPENAPAESIVWVAADDLFAAEPAPAESSAPIETDDGDEDTDDVDVPADLQAAFPKGTAVLVRSPNEPEFQGTIKGHGSGRFAGRVQVIPAGAARHSYKWVEVQALVAPCGGE